MKVDPSNTVRILTSDVDKYRDLIIVALQKGFTIRLEPMEQTWYDICLITSRGLPALVIGEDVVRSYFERFEPVKPIAA